MRYAKGHKDATRRRIVEAASQRFRKEGVERVGVAGLMAEAGLTHGGFYAHFPSKEDLVREAVSEGFAATHARFERLAQAGGLEAIVREYLSPRHRDQPERGCTAAALTAEVARHPEPTRLAFTERTDALIGLIAEQLPGHDRRRASAILALMLGALQLARAETDPERSQELLDSAVDAALALASEACAKDG
jgi:AcrR family transcriptional regulator